jgi:hypothetical protein
LAIDINNIIVDLDGPVHAPAPAVKLEDDDSDDFEFGSDDIDGADNVLVFSAFDHAC